MSLCLDEETILRFFRGELSSEEIAGVDRHIDRCQTCRVLLGSLAATELRDGPFSASAFASQAASITQRSPSSTTEPSGPSSVSAGVVLSGRFVLEDLVGQGGMARVFKGTDRQTGATVAIKITDGRGPEDLARFEREARLLRELSHPAIVRHIAHGRAADGLPYLVMEWLEGEDLAARLSRGPLDTAQTLQLAERLAGALTAAHALGVIHRDIKPSNVYLRDKEVARATLLDFGVARPSWQVGASFATQTGSLLGTLGYMAPEQALGAKRVDARADIFSLGCVLFECLVGSRPFGGAHAVEVLANLLTQPIRGPRAHVPEVPEALDGLIVRMLSRNPGERPADGSSVSGALARLPHAAGAKRALHLRPATWLGLATGLAAATAFGFMVRARAASSARGPSSAAETSPVSEESRTWATTASGGILPDEAPSPSAPQTAEVAPKPPGLDAAKASQRPQPTRAPSAGIATQTSLAAEAPSSCTVATEYDVEGQPHFRKVCP